MEHLSRFKLEESISQEIKAFSTGFWKARLAQKIIHFKIEIKVQHMMITLHRKLTLIPQVLPQKCLQVFTPSELTLLISGVPKIDVEDWINNTKVSIGKIHVENYNEVDQYNFK